MYMYPCDWNHSCILACVIHPAFGTMWAWYDYWYIMDSGRSRCWENIWSCYYLTILRHAIQLFVGCFGSSQLPRPPGYEDPVTLSTETSCKSVVGSIEVSKLYSRCPCLQQHLSIVKFSELIGRRIPFFCCLSLFLYVKI